MVSSDAVGGFVGLAGNGNGLTSTGRVQMGGLDYEKSPFYDAATNTWHPSVAGPDGGLDILKYQLTQQTYDKLQVPLGTDAMMIMQQRAADLAAQTPSTTGRTEYIPELLKTSGPTAPGTLPVLPHVQENNRKATMNAANGDFQPYTGFGFSATRPAYDPGNGTMLPVIPNQELVSPYNTIDAGSRQVRIDPSGNETQTVDYPTAGNPHVTTTDPADIKRFNDYLISIGLPPRF